LRVVVGTFVPPALRFRCFFCHAGRGAQAFTAGFVLGHRRRTAQSVSTNVP